MGPPISSQHYAPNRHRRRSRRTTPRRPYRAVLLALALTALVVWVAHFFDRPLHEAAAGARVPGIPLGLAGAPGAEGGQLGVSGLAPGACWALPPTSGDRGRTVFIDAGHGGPDPGALGVGITEKQATLGVALQLAPLLRAAGWRVVLSRTTDSSVTRLGDSDLDGGAMRGSALHRDLVARVACANAARAEALVSIHFNGFDDPSVGGTQTFYDADRGFADRSLRLAQALQSSLVKRLGREDRGVENDADLEATTITDAGASYGHLVELGPALPGWVDAPSAMPGALVEPLFVTDPEEAALVTSRDGQLQVARAIFEGLSAYLG